MAASTLDAVSAPHAAASECSRHFRIALAPHVCNAGGSLLRTSSDSAICFRLRRRATSWKRSLAHRCWLRLRSACAAFAAAAAASVATSASVPPQSSPSASASCTNADTKRSCCHVRKCTTSENHLTVPHRSQPGTANSALLAQGPGSHQSMGNQSAATSKNKIENAITYAAGARIVAVLFTSSSSCGW